MMWSSFLTFAIVAGLVGTIIWLLGDADFWDDEE